jgi:TolB-like protein
MTLLIANNPKFSEFQVGLSELPDLGQIRSWKQGERSISAPALPGDAGSARSKPTDLSESHARAIRAELSKVLRNPIFVQSDRLSRFLRFAVEMTLQGSGELLKEYTIGVEAYGRRPDFDPSQDSIVRTEARRLRAKLKKYYQEEGNRDPIVIDFQPGSYVPAFQVNAEHPSPEVRRNDTHAFRADQVTISVLPFTHLAGDAFGEACAQGLTDEFMHRLTGTEGIRVFARSAGSIDALSASRPEEKQGTWITSEGFVRTERNRIRVTSRLHDAGGLQVASWRFDAETEPDELFAALERLASEIVSCISDKANANETTSIAGIHALAAGPVRFAKQVP